MKISSYLNAFSVALIMICSLGSIDLNAQKAKQDLGAVKVAFLTDRLDISAEEATAFWPVYNEFQAKRKVLRAERNGTEGVDVEAKQKILDLEKAYIPKFDAVIPGKVDLLFQAEKEWRQELIEAMKRTKNK